MSIEDSLTDSIEGLSNTSKTIDNLSKLEMFYDSEEIKPLLIEIKEELNLTKISINHMIKRFTELSKQKYIIVEENDKE